MKPEDIISNDDVWEVIKAKADLTVKMHFFVKDLDLILFHITDIARQPWEEVV